MSRNNTEAIDSVDRNNSASGVNNDSNDQQVNNTILCILWKTGKLGAAYYNFDEKLLYIYEEIVDLAPQYIACRSLYREVNPKYIVTFGSIGDDFVKALIDILATSSSSDGDATVSSDGLRNLPPNFYLLPMKEYDFDICKVVLSQINLSSSYEETDVMKRTLHIHSLINFDDRMSVHAIGALVKYLDKNWAFFGSSKDELMFLHIHQISLKNHVLMDWISFNALQIFRQRSHESNTKRGVQGSNREGLSLFKLFSTHCKSKLGQNCLKNVLLQPINDHNELNRRLDFIAFVLQPINQGYIESLQDNIKSLVDVNLILFKIQNSRANARDWSTLYKSIYHSVFMSELSAPFRFKSMLIDDLSRSISEDLMSLERTISNALDFSNKNMQGRPIIKFGLDENLDAKKLRREDITKHVTAAARLAVNELPNFLSECTIVYLPEMGHLIAVKEWEPDCNPDQLQNLGFEFMFTLNGTIHYKNAMCTELDKCLGDINGEIIAHENRILHRLAGFVLKYNKDIREPLRIIAMMDCLISMGKIALQNNYVRPSLNANNVHEIVNCRHPLMELVYQFQSNDFYSGANLYSHIKVITGPNGSGKSIYLKQVGLVVYMAHIGSYVPARQANIGMVYSIHTRMQATESAAVRLSAFMIDVIQMTQALHNAKRTSLILLDEFGRGTTGDEGFALLVATLKKFNDQIDCCPHILVSTHFQKISNYLPQSQLVDHMKMEHTKDGGECLLFLYKVVRGISTSFAFDIAAEVGLDRDIVKRASDLFVRLRDNQTIEPLKEYDQSQDISEQFLMDLKIPEADD